MKEKGSNILLFDGLCNLCIRLVNFIIHRDPEKKFRFAYLQSETGEELMKRQDRRARQAGSVIFIHDGLYYYRSSAILRVMQELGGIWRLFSVLRIIPGPVRDFVYNIIAKTRYHVFGKRESCPVPGSGIKERFLEETSGE